jgi:hypothetical protein
MRGDSKLIKPMASKALMRIICTFYPHALEKRHNGSSPKIVGKK